MKVIKRRLFRIFFALELMVFAGVYLFGPNGMYALQQLERENKQLHDETVALQEQVQELECKISQWDAHSLYKEKIAREQLQMARKDDVVYYIS